LAATSGTVTDGTLFFVGRDVVGPHPIEDRGILVELVVFALVPFRPVSSKSEDSSRKFVCFERPNIVEMVPDMVELVEV
jgi:hypothetical protein